jgi:hypothetical protein
MVRTVRTKEIGSEQKPYKNSAHRIFKITEIRATHSPLYSIKPMLIHTLTFGP